MIRIAAFLLACVAAAAALENVEQALFRARHLESVQGDLAGAIEAYKSALKSLDKTRQAEVHLRIARCYAALPELEAALGHLAAPIYGHPGVDPEVRRSAEELRRQLEANLPRPARTEPANPRAEDSTKRKRKQASEHVARARNLLKRGDDIRAYFHVSQALELEPGNADARELAAEIDLRLSGLGSFLRDQLKLLRSWQEARTVQVAQRAGELLREAIGHVRAGRVNLSEARFREAIETIDASEFARESDPLIELRLAIETRWRDARHRRGAPPPSIESSRRRSTLRADLLDHLQRMMDVISTPDREYRIIPVSKVRRGEGRRTWRRKPDRFALLQDRPSTWTTAGFARHFVPARIHGASWRERGHYLEAAGGMLVARNRPEILNAVEKELRRLDDPEPDSLQARFLVVSATPSALARLQRLTGPFERSRDDDSPLHYLTVPARYSLEYLSGLLRDEGSEVRLPQDLFEVELKNGAAQTLYVARSIRDAAGYEALRDEEARYGVLLDVYPFRERTGRTALGMRVEARSPAPPLQLGADRLSVRTLEQNASIFADLAPDATLLVAGLVDPFAAGEGSEAPDRTLMVIWKNAVATAPSAAGEAEPPPHVEVSLRDLLLPGRVRDDPGPRRDPARGFVPLPESRVIRERARFLESLLHSALGSEGVRLDLEGAVLEVAPELSATAAELVDALERQSRRSFVLRAEVRAVRTHAFERWMRREQLVLNPFGEGFLAMSDAPDGAVLFRNLASIEMDDSFTGKRALPAITALGLQARHTIRAQLHTSPAYESDADLATGDIRTVTEGLRITARPYVWRGVLKAEIDVEIAAVNSEVEELALTRAVPSYRTLVNGWRATGNVEFGPVTRPRTALICRLPHPLASTPDRLTELAIAVSIRALP